jgi:hypothetical protein
MAKGSLATRLRHLVKRIPGIGSLYYGLRLALRPTYREDGLSTIHNADFLKDADFLAAYAAGEKMQPGTHLRWRAHVVQWAGCHASLLEGDFVECGVDRAFLSSCIIQAVHFEKMTERNFFLFDTYCGLVDELVTEHDKAAYYNEYTDVYAFVRNAFADYPNVHVIRGVVPDVLPTVDIERVAYLSIDMNCRAPEVAAVEYFWPKLVRGGIILFDDYGFSGHEAQKEGADQFAQSVGTKVLSLPTGQGLLIKHTE